MVLEGQKFPHEVARIKNKRKDEWMILSSERRYAESLVGSVILLQCAVSNADSAMYVSLSQRVVLIRMAAKWTTCKCAHFLNSSRLMFRDSLKSRSGGLAFMVFLNYFWYLVHSCKGYSD